MAWRIEYDEAAEKDFSKLDRQIARRIVKFLGLRGALVDNPSSIGEALKGSNLGDLLGDFWKYRIGGYRVVAEI
jgi:mRNA interferase RelE/StbE